MNKNKNSKIMLVLSILLMFLVIGAVSAADETSNETVSTTTNDGVEAISHDGDNVDEKTSTTDNLGSVDVNSNITIKDNEIKLTNNNNNEDILKSDNNDILSDTSDDTFSFSELNQLIRSESSNIFTLTKNVMYNSTTDNNINGININKAIIIDGNNKIIDAQGHKLFNINSENVVIKNLIINNMTGLLFGGGIDIKANNFLMDNVNIYYSTWAVGGGNIKNITIKNSKFKYNKQSVIHLFNCNNIHINHNIIENTTITSTGAVDQRYSSVYLYFCIDGHVDYCNFTNNTAYSATGVCVMGENGQYSVSHSRFINNTQQQSSYPNCVLHALNNELLKVSECYFENPVYGYVSGQNSETELIKCVFKNFNVQTNTQALSIDNCSFNGINDYSVVQAGKGSSIRNSNFTNIKYSGTLINLGTDNVVEDCTFEDINVPYIINAVSTDVIRNNHFKGNNITCTNGYWINIQNNLNATIENNDKLENINTTASNVIVNPLNMYEGIVIAGPDNISNIIKNIKTNTTIYLQPGNYTTALSPSSRYNLIGLDKENTIIKTKLTDAYTIKNLTIKTSFSFQTVGYEIYDCILDGCTPVVFAKQHFHVYNTEFRNMNNPVYVNSYSNDYKFVNVTFNNCNGNIFNNFNYVEGLFVYDNITIKDSKFDYVWNKAFGWHTVNNLTITNSTFKGITTQTTGNKNPFNGFTQIFKLELDIVNLENITLTGDLFNLNQVSSLDLDDFTGYNISSNSALFNLKLDYGSVVKNVDLTLVNSSNALYTTSNAVDIDTFSVKKSNFTNGFSIVDGSINHLSMDDVVFTNYMINVSGGVSVSDSVFENVNGSFIIDGERVILTRCSFIACNSTSDGLIMIKKPHTRLYDCIFTSNKGVYGGAVNIDNVDTNFYNCQFTDNTATKQGGAIYSNYTQVYLYLDTTSQHGLVTETGIDNPLVNGFYIRDRLNKFSVIYLYNNASIFTEDDVYYTNSLEDALSLINPNGKIYLNGSGDVFQYSRQDEFDVEGVTLNASSVYFNMAESMIISGDDITLIGITFENSTGSALIWKNDDGKIINCTFKDNGDVASHGGALQVLGNNLVINQTIFNDNKVTSDNGDNFGGAIYFNATGLKLDNCTFDNNDAVRGLHLYQTSSSNDLEMKNTIFKNLNGQSSSIMGGVYLNGFNVIIDNCTFMDNDIGGNGAGLYIDTNDKVVLISNNFTSNRASNGAAIYVKKGILNISNSNFTENVASVNGGAIYSQGTLNIDGGIFTGNSAAVNGGALYLSGNSVLNGVIFTGNRADEGSAIYMNNGKLELNSVNLTENTNTGGKECTIHINSGASFSVGDGVLFLSKDSSGVFDQYLCGDYKLDVLYVSSDGTGSGWFRDAPASLTTESFEHLNDGAKVVFLNNGEFNVGDVAVVMKGLKNIALVGNGSTIIRNDNKSLFNNT